MIKCWLAHLRRFRIQGICCLQYLMPVWWLKNWMSGESRLDKCDRKYAIQQEFDSFLITFVKSGLWRTFLWTVGFVNGLSTRELHLSSLLALLHVYRKYSTMAVTAGHCNLCVEGKDWNGPKGNQHFISILVLSPSHLALLHIHSCTVLAWRRLLIIYRGVCAEGRDWNGSVGNQHVISTLAISAASLSSLLALLHIQD